MDHYSDILSGRPPGIVTYDTDLTCRIVFKFLSSPLILSVFHIWWANYIWRMARATVEKTGAGGPKRGWLRGWESGKAPMREN